MADLFIGDHSIQLLRAEVVLGLIDVQGPEGQILLMKIGLGRIEDWIRFYED